MSSTLRPYALAVLLAVLSATVAIAVAEAFGLPLRDPDGIAGPAYVRLPAIVVLFVLTDVVPPGPTAGEAGFGRSFGSAIPQNASWSWRSGWPRST